MLKHTKYTFKMVRHMQKNSTRPKVLNRVLIMQKERGLAPEIITYTLLAKKLCDSSFLGKYLDLIHPHFNMYGFRSYLFL